MATTNWAGPVCDVMPPLALLRLLQLTSPALPIGAFAYSQGLEYAVESGWVRDEETAGQWIEGLLRHSLANNDVPILRRLYVAWQSDDKTTLQYWNGYLLGSREAAELQQEDLNLGQALMRLLASLGVDDAREWLELEGATYATAFALAAVRWQIVQYECMVGYLWAWAENQVAAAIKLVPLGQTSGQRILQLLLPAINESAQLGMALADHEIGYSAPAFAIGSALHETQYSRLFRS